MCPRSIGPALNLFLAREKHFLYFLVPLYFFFYLIMLRIIFASLKINVTPKIIIEFIINYC
jgi:hypothetical protein